MKNILITKDSCVDGITSEILKHAFKEIPNRICNLFRTSITTGSFPRKWAKEYVNVLPKSGDLKNPGNWRPITQTCVPAKLLEKALQSRIMKIMIDNDFMSKINLVLSPNVQHNRPYLKLYMIFITQ